MPVEVAYDVVADVAAYPEFLPGCRAVTIESPMNAAGELVASVQVAGKGMQEHFVTRNTHVPVERVTMSLREGPFRTLEGAWTFKALGDDGCRVDLDVRFEARGMIATLLSPMAEGIADLMVDAFVERIETIHSGSR